MSEGRVFIVDDEAALRVALERLLKAEGFEVTAFDSAEAFLAGVAPGQTGCLILDVAMPDVDGLELQRRIAGTHPAISVVFLTGHGDIPMSVRAMREGAWDFLTKPVRSDDLLNAVRAALERAQAHDSQAKARAELARRLGQLTAREREVFEEVIAGRLNKIIADRLGISEQTVKVHRGRVMEKVGVDSVAELVRVAHLLGVEPAR